MKRFLYHINDDLITGFEEIQDIPEGFISCQHDLGPDTIYYKIEGTTITCIIGEGMTEGAARRRAEDFLSYLVVNIF